MPVEWPDAIDEILAGDLCAGLAYLTPAEGVVIAPMAPLALRDRSAGTLAVTTSLAMWRKLDRIRRHDAVAVAFHAREYGLSRRPEFVLVQGRASFDPTPDRAWLESITPQWDRFLGPRHHGVRGRMMAAYYWERVAITIVIERVVAYPDTTASGDPVVYGAARAEPAPSQAEPKGGTAPRVDVAKVAAAARRLPHTLLGWAGSDGLPDVVPASVAGAGDTGDAGVRLTVPDGVPVGGRRAGLTSHQFQPRMVGQEQRVHTGWLERDDDGVRYAPHTRAGYRMPASSALFVLASSVMTSARLRGAKRALAS
jgi:hypothetical protein